MSELALATAALGLLKCSGLGEAIGKKLQSLLWDSVMCPIYNSFAHLFRTEGVKDGICKGQFVHNPRLFKETQGISKVLLEQCILNPAQHMGCTIVWGPAGAGKTFTVCNLIEIARKRGVGVKYQRVDWAKYTGGCKDMKKWMGVQGVKPPGEASGGAFKLIFMDHYDRAMGSTSETRDRGMNFLREMIDLAGKDWKFTMVVCVNVVENVALLKTLATQLPGSPIRTLMCGEGRNSMMWTSSSDGADFARLVFQRTPSDIRDRVLPWGEGADNDEAKIKKLADLIVHDGAVQRTVLFLSRKLTESLDVYLCIPSSVMVEWQRGLRALDETRAPELVCMF
jgi:hypothetical protein